jgi:ABC-type transporter Mla subunit MlaD
MGMGAAHADPTNTSLDDTTGGITNPADLLNSASTDLTDGSNVLSGVAAPSESLLAVLVTDQTAAQDAELQVIANLQSAQNFISSHDDSLSGLVNQLFFTPVDQELDHASQAILSADQALATAVSSGSGVPTAELELIGTDLQFFVVGFDSLPIDFAALLLGDSDLPSSAGSDVGAAGADLATTFDLPF